MENYGEDGDTIKLKDPKDEEISLKDIWEGETSQTGSYTENKEKIEELLKKEKELNDLKKLLAETTATEDKILKDFTAYVKDSLVTGTMEDRGVLEWNPTEGTTYTVPAGYYSGGTLNSQTVYNKGVEDGRVGYYTKAQYDANYTTGYNAGVNNVIPTTTSFSTTLQGSPLVSRSYINCVGYKKAVISYNCSISNWEWLGNSGLFQFINNRIIFWIYSRSMELYYNN